LYNFLLKSVALNGLDPVMDLDWDPEPESEPEQEPKLFHIRNRNSNKSISSTTLININAYCDRTAQCQQQRGMANLKLIGLRLKSVKNIQKITQAVKMVSSPETDSTLSFFSSAVRSKTE
jgi:hypothetical protein